MEMAAEGSVATAAVLRTSRRLMAGSVFGWIGADEPMLVQRQRSPKIHGFEGELHVSQKASLTTMSAGEHNKQPAQK
jgi:hypothetical protein